MDDELKKEPLPVDRAIRWLTLEQVRELYPYLSDLDRLLLSADEQAAEQKQSG